MKKRILIIKLGALGDVVMSTGAIKAIREHHPEAHIALLTTKPQLSILKNNPNVDEIILDDRKKPWNLFYLADIYKKLQGWDFIYDLQNNRRTTGVYFRLAKNAQGKKPNWSGIAEGCSHPQPKENRPNMHVVDMLNDQLKHAGISTADYWPNISYAKQDCSEILSAHHINPEKLVVLVPGCSASRPMKRWPHYAALAKVLMEKGYQVAVIGTNDERDVLDAIEKETGCINLCNKTNLGQLLDLTGKAHCVIGNDTGPIHMAAASGAKGVGIFGWASNTVRSSPRGEGMTTIKKEDIGAITPQEVLQAALLSE